MKYIHTVQYYETDKMGVAHHSNFIRWFEEARVDFLNRIGVPYDKLEETGLTSPVLSAECRYIKSARFGERVEIETRLTELGNVKFAFSYRVFGEDGSLRAEGATRHCFITPDGNVTSLKKQQPELFRRLEESLGK